MQQDTTQIIIALAAIPILLILIWRIRLKRLALYQSKILGKIEVLKKYDGEKVLTTNGYLQGISIQKKSIEQSYFYTVAFEAVKFCQDKNKPIVLTLGLGANTIPNLIAKLNPNIQQTIVDIDADIIQACQNFFALDKLPKSQIIQADVYELAEQKNAFAKQFDVVIVDVFTGEPPYISLKSNQPNFIEKLLPWLKRDGMIIFNRPAHKEKLRADGLLLEKYLKTLFKNTQVFDIKDPRGYRNYVITAKLKVNN